MADIPIYGPVRSMAGEGKAAYAAQIYDEDLGMFQSEINQQGGGGGGGSNPSGLFIAEYGVTTYQEIQNAITAGKLPICIDQQRVHVFAANQSNTNTIVLSCTMISHTRVNVNSQNTWWRNTDSFENSANKVTSISSSSTNTQYPSAKAVYDEVGNVEDVLDAILGDSAYSTQMQWGVISQTQTWTGSLATGYDYTMSDLVHGWIPKANIDLFVSAGATFNETSGYFELNGLEDISYEEMQKIYAHSANLLTRRTDYSYLFYDRQNLIRTICPLPPLSSLGNPNFQWAFYNNALEVAPMNGYVSSLSQTFRVTNYLRDAGKINLSNITTSGGVSNSFLASYSLESIQLTGLKVSIEFTSSSRLSVPSILYMITNEASTSAITITLHPTAYARAIADADVQTALSNHTNVTLASA